MKLICDLLRLNKLFKRREGLSPRRLLYPVSEANITTLFTMFFYLNLYSFTSQKFIHDVIMSPSDPLYFNRYQADPQHEPLAAKFSINTLERVYQYNPWPNALTNQQKRFVIGGQAAIWTEFVSSIQHLEYMLLPRLPAIAEALWTPLGKKDFSGFVDRLNGWHFNAWQQKGIRFHPAYFTSQTHEGNRK